MPSSSGSNEPSADNQPSSSGGKEDTQGEGQGGEGSQGQKKYEPPAAALPYRGNEVELVESYADPDPTNPAIARTDAVEDVYETFVYTTFTDGTIKTSNPEEHAADDKEEISPSDFGETNVKITPGPGTPLDKLGVIQVSLPFSGSGYLGPYTIKYGDGKSIETNNFGLVSGKSIVHKDSKGNVIETIFVDNDKQVTYSIKPDGSRSDYKADGSYITTWPKKADGSQQFYDSRQEKVFVRDANGNIIPPKE